MTITRILAANRGEIVSRIARSARRRGAETVAVYAASDADAHYLSDADVAYYLGDDEKARPYLDIALLIRAAQETRCDAVHPGFGFVAENATFARAVIDSGLIWIGPSPAAIDAMGPKVQAKRIAVQAGVAVLESIELTDDVEAAALQATRTLTPPLLVKPSAGGGGKGMHRVDDVKDLAKVLVAAQREAQASFGDPTLFIERYLETARHVEVQVMADTHGNVIHLGTRDCSVQRRHQKIIEEAPAPGLSEELAAKMCTASVELARSIEYTGAGTVEFMVFGDEYAFLEMNTRLQVEHPVTEQVTGVDLVDLQIAVADGARLPIVQDDVAITGHSFEVRLYAEDPAAGFLPSPGVVDVFEWDAGLARWEVGVSSGSRVSPKYDPMIAKIVTTGRNRDEARLQMIRALRGMVIGGVKTNRDMLLAVLSNVSFADGCVPTRFLDDNPDLAITRPCAKVRAVNVIAAVLSDVVLRRRAEPLQGFAPFGWRNVRSALTNVEVMADDEAMSVGYRSDRTGRQWTVELDDAVFEVESLTVDTNHVDLVIGGIRHRVAVRFTDSSIVAASIGGQTVVSELDPLVGESEAIQGRLASPLPGTVISIERAVGDQVEAGEVLVVIEAMKMEHSVRAVESGVVTALHVKVGEVVEHDQTLVEMDDEK
ncbi:ATP-binding protein [Rhodococcoides yunnanense]|uniref:ATP-binding protein n=1 Tax=Rhodococcoides yunnanense TaxID=278209 RepID=UPI002481C4EF|nr:biotin carboxylase N-terminal domain-containing protein [Rhodococcus yunnanensis]